MTPRISLVLLTKHGGSTLPKVLESLWKQRTSGTLEIIAIDSGSTDDTLELLEPRVTRLIQIRPSEFNHGSTRNQAIEKASGEFVVILVQDALPVGDTFLEALVAPFATDPTIAGTFARQIPRRGASALTKHYLRHWIAYSNVPRTSRLQGVHGGEAELQAMPPLERMRFCAFDNVASCIRRSVWKTHPFQHTPIAEDLRWGREVLLAGHAIAFVPEAVVEHSHDRSAMYEYRRTRVLHEQLFDLFGIRTIPTLPALGRSVVTSTFHHLRVEAGSPARLPAALALAVAWPLGQYVGGRRAERGGGRPMAAGKV
jgi:rhamnosyltransferase